MYNPFQVTVSHNLLKFYIHNSHQFKSVNYMITSKITTSIILTLFIRVGIKILQIYLLNNVRERTFLSDTWLPHR